MWHIIVLSYTIFFCLLDDLKIHVGIQSFYQVVGPVLPDIIEYNNIIWLYSILVKSNHKFISDEALFKFKDLLFVYKSQFVI